MGELLVPSLPSLLPLLFLAFGAALLLSLGVGVREEGSLWDWEGRGEGGARRLTGMKARLKTRLG